MKHVPAIIALTMALTGCHAGGRETAGLTPIYNGNFNADYFALSECSFTSIEMDFLEGSIKHAGHIQKSELSSVGQVRLAWFYDNFRGWEVRFVKAGDKTTRVEINVASSIWGPEQAALEFVPLIEDCAKQASLPHVRTLAGQ